MEADQIKHNAVVICNSSESSVNLVLGMSHTVAVEANVKANLEIQQFVNTTSEMVVDGKKIYRLHLAFKVWMLFIIYFDNLLVYSRND